MIQARYAIIVAGGKGTRMGSQIPKQFLPIAGKPVLMHTLERFAQAKTTISVVLVLPQNQFEPWEALCKKYRFTLPHQCVIGGATRTESVFNGLQVLPEQGLVAVHDGVRPLVSDALIERAYQTAAAKGNAIAAVPLKDSIRQLHPDGTSYAVDRSMFQLVQTPQTFQLALFKEAYRQAMQSAQTFTDDASVAEAAGHTIHLVSGDYQNIKITTPEDLQFAEAFLRFPQTHPHQ